MRMLPFMATWFRRIVEEKISGSISDKEINQGLNPGVF